MQVTSNNVIRLSWFIQMGIDDFFFAVCLKKNDKYMAGLWLYYKFININHSTIVSFMAIMVSWTSFYVNKFRYYVPIVWNELLNLRY